MSTVTTEGTRQAMPVRSDNPNESLAALPASSLWRPSAPAAVRKKWDDDPAGSWRAWAKELKDKPSVEGLGGPAAAVAWGLDPASHEAGQVRAALAVVDSKAKPEEIIAAAQSFIESGGPLSIGSALETVAWAYAMPAAAGRLEGDLWWRVVDAVLARIEAAQGLEVDEEADAESLLLQQLLIGEAGLTLASLLGDLAPLKPIRKDAAEALSEGILAFTDGEGLPPARCLPLLPLLVACWTRCRAVAEHSGKRAFDSAAQTQYEWLVRQTIRLARPDGSPATTTCPPIPTGLWNAALRFGGDESDETAASLRLRPKPAKESDTSAPEPSVESEWSSLAVLASGWKPRASRITIAYEDDRFLLEAASGGAVLVSGEWPVDILMEGQQVETAGEWEQQCWFSDEDSDYLELSIDLANGAKLERCVLLAHDMQVAYLTEIVLSKTEEPGALEVTSRLPLVEGVSLKIEDETREGWLMNGDQRLAGVVPLAMPEWKIDPRPGDLTVVDGCLQQSQGAIARNLCLPLVLDLKPTRFAKQRTWRQLTIAQHLERVGPDVAVGYRYQSGKDQLMVYRSLEAPANRTLLGQNYSSEAVIGRFLPSGEVDEYFEIDDED